jgi:hypothetical protein
MMMYAIIFSSRRQLLRSAASLHFMMINDVDSDQAFIINRSLNLTSIYLKNREHCSGTKIPRLLNLRADGLSTVSILTARKGSWQIGVDVMVHLVSPIRALQLSISVQVSYISTSYDHLIRASFGLKCTWSQVSSPCSMLLNHIRYFGVTSSMF